MNSVLLAFLMLHIKQRMYRYPS